MRQNVCQHGLPKAVVEYLPILMVCVDKIGMWPLVLCFLSYQRLVKGQHCPEILTFDPNKTFSPYIITVRRVGDGPGYGHKDKEVGDFDQAILFPISLSIKPFAFQTRRKKEGRMVGGMEGQR